MYTGGGKDSGGVTWRDVRLVGRSRREGGLDFSRTAVTNSRNKGWFRCFWRRVEVGAGGDYGVWYTLVSSWTVCACSRVCFRRIPVWSINRVVQHPNIFGAEPLLRGEA